MNLKFFGVFLNWTIALTCAAHDPVPKQDQTYVESKVKFNSVVGFTADSQPAEDETTKIILQQLSFMAGPLQTRTFYSSPKMDHHIFNIKIVKGNSANTYFAYYSYEGTVAVSPGKKTLEVLLPTYPERIYSSEGLFSSPCLMEYAEQAAFRGYWNPKRPGCPLKKGLDYQEIVGVVYQEENKEPTYPEYDRLLDSSDGTISISVMFGPLENTIFGLAQDENLDIQFKHFMHWLESAGFRPTQKNQPYHTQDYFKATPKGKIRIALRIVNPGSIDFAIDYSSAISNSSVVIYSGHAGLGRFLSLKKLDTALESLVQLNAEKYQIFEFNACNTYSYYSQEYFDRKVSYDDPFGTRNLDIISTVNPAPVSRNTFAAYGLVYAIDAWATDKKRMSYQDIQKWINQTSPLFIVSGDKDNK